MSLPLVSVIIPSYNSGRYLADALRSVSGQDYKRMEVIVIDDGSTDDTVYVVRSFKDIIYTFQANRGPSSARNTGQIGQLPRISDFATEYPGHNHKKEGKG